MSQFWFNQTSATSDTASILYPWGLAGQGYQALPFQALPSVTVKHGEYAGDRDAKLAPIEWLTRQIEDVCRLAAFA